MSRKSKSLETESELMGMEKVTANVYGDLYGVMELLYKWILWLVAQLCRFTKTH